MSVWLVWKEYDDMSGRWGLRSVHSTEALAEAEVERLTAAKDPLTWGDFCSEEWEVDGDGE